MCSGTVWCWVVSAYIETIGFVRTEDALTEEAAKITQACMHRVKQWLRAQYAQRKKERKKNQDFRVICVKSKSSLKL